MYEFKIYRGVLCPDIKEWCKIWRGIDVSVQNLTWALENLKNLHFNGLLLNKVHNIWAKKKYREVLLDDTEYWCNISRKTDLCFQKLHGEFSKFSLENLKTLHFNGLLLNKVYNVWAKKSIGEYFKNDMRDLANFRQSMFKSLKIGTLMGSFYPK